MPISSSVEDSWTFQHLDSLIDSLLGNLEINIGNSLESFQTSSNSSGETGSIFGGSFTDEIWSNNLLDSPNLFSWGHHATGSLTMGGSPTLANLNGHTNQNAVNANHNRVSLGTIAPTSSTPGSIHIGATSVGQPSGRVPTLNGATIVNGINLATLKFVKPAPQCFYWENRQHRVEQPNCRLWHPRELCKYYPKCTLSAEVCGFGHPFCGDFCECDPKNRSLQVNHRIVPNHLLSASEFLKFGHQKSTLATFTTHSIINGGRGNGDEATLSSGHGVSDFN